MTRKDYELIAKALRQADVCSTNATVKGGVYLAFSILVDSLAEENAGFNKEKFFKVVYDK